MERLSFSMKRKLSVILMRQSLRIWNWSLQSSRSVRERSRSFRPSVQTDRPLSVRRGIGSRIRCQRLETVTGCHFQKISFRTCEGRSGRTSHRRVCQQNRWTHGKGGSSKGVTAWEPGITISGCCDHQWKVCECSSSLSVRAGIPALWSADHKAEHGKLVYTFGRGISIHPLWSAS